LKLIIDTDARTLDANGRSVDLYSADSFAELSRLWIKVGWHLRYSYQFSWLGRPVIQLPEDLVRAQELVWQLRPDVVVETGVAHGGSLVFYASLLRLIGHGRIVGVDIEIRPHNRAAIEQHPLRDLISLVEGDSTNPGVVDAVRAQISPGERVLVVLDSNHTKAHVAAELRAYADLVSVGSYIVATDGIMPELADTPRGSPSWSQDSPAAAIAQFLDENRHFELVPPHGSFNESDVRTLVTYWPNAYLRRVR
jgi:cephalosporin hydroxylase